MHLESPLAICTFSSRTCFRTNQEVDGFSPRPVFCTIFCFLLFCIILFYLVSCRKAPKKICFLYKNLSKSFTFWLCRKLLFDTHVEDINYNPAPEERPGGFDWGAGAAAPAAAEPAAADAPRQNDGNQ